MTEQTQVAQNDWIVSDTKRKAFWAKVAELGEAAFGFGADNAQSWAKRILLGDANGSMKDYTGTYDNAIAVLERAADANDILPGDETPKQGSQYPLDTQDVWFNPTYWKESPCAVFPQPNGGYVYKGVRFSVTRRFGCTQEMVDCLLEQFIADKANIDPACFVRPAAPAQSPVDLSKPTTRLGDKPAQTSAPTAGGPMTEKVVKIIREFDNNKKIPFTGLYTQFGNAPGKFPTYRVQDSHDSTLEVLAKLTGILWTEAALGTEYPCNITATYEHSEKLDKGGKPYHNLKGLSA